MVELLDGHLRYARDERSVTVPVEYVLLDAGELRVYESTLRAWDTPRGGGIIPSIERSGILKEVVEALRALGVPHRICA